MLGQLKPLIGKLSNFSKERMGFSHPPKLFLKKDADNSQKALGKTAFYDPSQESVTVFISGRHPKDILRSIAHEFVHHIQNLRGDLSPDKMGSMSDTYAQDSDHMRNMEKEAYLVGNMCFRDFEDSLDDKDKKMYKLAESKFLKENKTMTTKITNDFLRKEITKILNENIQTNEVAGLGDSSRQINQKSKLSALEAEAMVRTMIDMFTDDNDGFGVMQTLDDLGAEMGRGKGNLGGEALAGLHRVYEALLKVNKRPGFDDEAPTDDAPLSEDLLDEMHCTGASPGKRNDGKKCGDKTCKSCYPVKEEKKNKSKKKKPELKNAKKADLNKDGKLSSYEKKRGKAIEKSMAAEGVHTPEGENSLYEQRFTPKNNRLFEKLIKDWTK